MMKNNINNKRKAKKSKKKFFQDLKINHTTISNN